MSMAIGGVNDAWLTGAARRWILGTNPYDTDRRVRKRRARKNALIKKIGFLGMLPRIVRVSDVHRWDDTDVQPLGR